MRRQIWFAGLLILAVLAMSAGCGSIHVNIGPESKKSPLREYVLEGSGREKILVIPIRGFISDSPRKGFLADRPSTVEEVAAQLRLAEKDNDVKAVLLEIDSPGGSTTASDIIYREIRNFKEQKGVKVVALFMDVAASGGYYVALPSDRILAHPTTITGSIGVIFLVPKINGLMEKIGVAVEVNKSGREKDMASPFRPTTPEEQKILDGLIATLGRQFADLVARHRTPGQEAMNEISSGRIYLASDALERRLIDRIGYVSDALSEARELAGLPKDARVIAYRRTRYPNDTIYNTSAAYGDRGLPLVELGLTEILPQLGPGFYYLWAPGRWKE